MKRLSELSKLFHRNNKLEESNEDKITKPHKKQINDEKTVPTKISDTKDWYLWLNLTEEGNRNKFVENHLELRVKFDEYGAKYKHLDIHNGDFEPFSNIVIMLAPHTVPSSRYCMAKTTSKYKSELYHLQQDLINTDLEDRIVGPTSELDEIKKYPDNFKLHQRILKRFTY